MNNDMTKSPASPAPANDPYLPSELPVARAGSNANARPIGTVPGSGNIPPTTFTDLAQHDPGPGGKNRKRLAILVLVIAVVVLGGLAAYATFLRPTSSEEKIKLAFSEMAKLDSVAADGSLTSNGGFNATFTSQIDSKNEALGVQLSAQALTTTMKADIIGVNDAVYIKLEGVADALGGFIGGAGDSKSAAQFRELVEGKHIRISQEDAADLPFGLGQTASNPDPQFSDADQQKLGELLADTEFFLVTEKLGSKDIKGASATGYKIVLQAEGMKQLVRGLRDIEAFKTFSTGQSVEDIEKELAGIKQEELDKVPFEVWLSGKYVAQVAVDVSEGDTKGRFELSFSRFNESFNLQAPADSRPLSEVINGVGNPLGATTSSSRLLTPSNLQ